MSPAIPLPWLVPLSLVLLAWSVWHAWKSGSSLPFPLRAITTSLRAVVVSSLCLILANPGRWTLPTHHNPPPWLVLVDSSASMKQAVLPGTSRADDAKSVAEAAESRAKSLSLPLSLQPFAATLQPACQANALPAPTGLSSRLIPSLTRAIQDAAAAGSPPAAVLLISDGRQSDPCPPEDFDALTLLARSYQTPIHTIAIGTETPPADLTLIQPRASFTAFPGQLLHIPFALQASNLPASRTTVRLLDASGNQLSSTQIDLSPGQTATAQFNLTAPSESTRWSIEIPPVPGEIRSANNRSSFSIRIISSKTRVFLAEGAPYWDSKFLAQLLRQQPHIEIRSVHRLSEQRYFRIDSGSTRQPESSHPVFPETIDEMRQYDVVILGKNTDPFLTPERVELLRSYVRDHGGALLFSRGKPTTAQIEALEPLEPVGWASSSISEFRLTPNSEGSAAGLFGAALPAPEAALWSSLPPLKDARSVSFVKPFTRVLADALPISASSPAHPTPALLVRRYGLGVTALVNGDGLWKWDFFPEARELGNCYEDFWVQLIQWTTAYSEFLPGQDFSLHLPSLQIPQGGSSNLSLSYRGPAPIPTPSLLITHPDGSSSKLSPAMLQDASGRPQWRTSFTADSPGNWSIQVVDPRPSPPQAPALMLSVPAPTNETEDLSPDPDLLKSLALATGGTFLRPAEFRDFARIHLQPRAAAEVNGSAVWSPSWNHPGILSAICLALAAEWFLRRRNGLA